MKYDAIIIGSGPSGGRIAHELVNSGAQVLLLEAGKYFKSNDFPKPEFESSAQMWWGGGVELSEDARLGFLRAKCIGGTSIVNQALLDRFDDSVWSDWTEKSGMTFSDQMMAPAYEAVEKSINLEVIDRKYFGLNTQIFTQAFDKKGLGWTPLRRGQKNCDLECGNDCIACLGGCPRSSKQSTLVTAVDPAVAKGLVVQAECEVQTVYESENEATVQTILKSTGEKKTFTGKIVVIAAGSFGTTKILLQSGFKNKLPHLGLGISCHPQYMTYALFDREVNAFKGAFQAVKSYDPNLRKQGLKFENVFAPPIATSMLMTGFGIEHLKLMQKYKFMASMEVAIRDDATGELSVSPQGKLIVRKKLTANDESKMARGLKLVEEMFSDAKPQAIIKCPQAFGLHLMGGCAIGTNEKTSVINPEYKVHGSKKLFCADSSVFPSAPGLNPSLSVMALSHLALKQIKLGLQI